ncbi:SDR family oxidoreductase [Runella slithyformis]|uniref:Epimerase n=1 Tax=Runella slithyformis (strain ATCC 29530 / DSM 19594 / LMG 11500 / NCIMB 11436 / LSU 4) TaxID=761193 RepID=A0A7U3ZHR3_RUNSL|nr:SDR family oxidoreductase [Runella slithyformis]AEI47395.1 epimerase [Runella slithyformis DSM 19594]
MKISILGCGWLGLPLAAQLIEEGHSVKGSTTSVEKLAVLRSLEIEPLWLQLTPEPKGIGWDYLLDCEVLIVNVPPRLERAGNDFHPAQLRHLTELVKESPVQRIIYISSTSVYPELNREVAEEDVIQPSQSAAPSLAEAEQLIQMLPQSWLVLRCGGLMGYERIPGKYVAGKKGITTGDVPVNYIHRDDVIGIIKAFIQNPSLWNETYNLTTPLHPTRREVYLASCAPFGYEPPTFQTTADNPYKIVSSQKLQDKLNYSFRFPNPLVFFYQGSNFV